MIYIQLVELLHNQLIDQFGGIKGIRDINLLQSALARPYATFDKEDLYPEPCDKAAAIFESLIINHPFIDGNKRIAYVMMRLTLNISHCDIKATQEEKYRMVINASQGNMRFDEIKAWLMTHLIEL
jgi:death-on-curing protein